MSGYKQVIAARRDLKMSPGKLAAQVAHGAVDAAEKAMRKKQRWFDGWSRKNRKKIVVRVQNDNEFLRLQKKADKLNVPFALVQNAGFTELPPDTKTVLAIGPAPDKILDKITGDLPVW